MFFSLWGMQCPDSVWLQQPKGLLTEQQRPVKVTEVALRRILWRLLQRYTRKVSIFNMPLKPEGGSRTERSRIRFTSFGVWKASPHRFTDGWVDGRACTSKDWDKGDKAIKHDNSSLRPLYTDQCGWKTDLPRTSEPFNDESTQKY